MQTRVQCNENSTRSYENLLSVSKLVKTAINTSITVKLLKSKVTLLNTCEKLKMTDSRNGYGDKMRNDVDKMRHFNEFYGERVFEVKKLSYVKKTKTKELCSDRKKFEQY